MTGGGDAQVEWESAATGEIHIVFDEDVRVQPLTCVGVWILDEYKEVHTPRPRNMVHLGFRLSLQTPPLHQRLLRPCSAHPVEIL